MYRKIVGHLRGQIGKAAVAWVMPPGDRTIEVGMPRDRTRTGMLAEVTRQYLVITREGEPWCQDSARISLDYLVMLGIWSVDEQMMGEKLLGGTKYKTRFDVSVGDSSEELYVGGFQVSKGPSFALFSPGLLAPYHCIFDALVFASEDIVGEREKLEEREVARAIDAALRGAERGMAHDVVNLR